MSVNYDRVCRLCLSSRGELLPIFPTTSSDDSEPPVLASKIKDCVSVQITENDDLPTKVCRKCVANVHNWHIFKSVCERTQNKLQCLIRKDGSQLEEVKIKSEPLSDEAYDDGVVIDGSYPEAENGGTSSKVQPEGPPILASLGLTPRSDKKYVDPRMDWQRVHAILDIVQEDEVIDSLQSTEEMDIVHQSDHDSDMEAELTFDVNDFYLDSENVYVCKDGSFLSKDSKTLKPIEEKVRKGQKHDPRIYCTRPKHAWQLLFTDDILELMVSATNEKIGRRGSDSTPTNICEIKTLVGILYMHGISRPIHQNCNDMWDEQYGVACIKMAMKYERFKYLLENLSFSSDNDETTHKYDVMKRIRLVFDMFVSNCRSAFEVKNSAVIDEIIVPIYGPCPFRYDISKKPLKQGVKLVLVVDPSNFYISNVDVITESQTKSEIVTKSVQHLSGTRKTIIMDSWFTSITVIETLKNEYQLYSIAALHPTDEMIPSVFMSKDRKCQSVLTGFLGNDKALSSYVTANCKTVCILTNNPNLVKRGREGVFQYKKNHSAVEVVDVLMHYYTTMQNCNDWTLSLFFTMLNIASINAQVIWGSQHLSVVTQRRLFIRDLASSLLEYEANIIPGPAKQMKYSNLRENNSCGVRRRCAICRNTTKIDRRTRQFCVICGTFVCGEHIRVLCVMCK